MPSNIKYRRCFVNTCTNSELKTPDKIFITVPRDLVRRKQWFRLANRVYVPTKTTYFCCEDHFDLKKDMHDYAKYKLLGGRIYMKKNAVPHIFDCEPQASKSANTTVLQRLNRESLTNNIIVKSEPDVITTEDNMTELFLNSDTFSNPEQSFNEKDVTIFNRTNYSNYKTVDVNGILEEITVYQNFDNRDNIREEFIIPDLHYYNIDATIPKQPSFLGQQSCIKEEFIVPD